MHRAVFAGRDGADADGRARCRSSRSSRRSSSPTRRGARSTWSSSSSTSMLDHGANEVGHPQAAADRPQALVRALAGGARGARLELAVLEQPRPAADRLPLRRRLARAPRALGEDARHDPAPAPRDAVRVPGRGARDDQHALRRDRRVPGHRVAEPLRRGDGRRRRPGRGAGVAADHEPRQRAHADAVGRGAAGGLHHRRAVDPGQRELPHDQRRGGGGGRGLGLPPLPAADRAAPHRAGRRARGLHDAAAGRRARLRVHPPAGRRRAARARQLLGRGGAGRARRPERRARARQLRRTRASRGVLRPWEARILRRRHDGLESTPPRRPRAALHLHGPRRRASRARR